LGLQEQRNHLSGAPFNRLITSTTEVLSRNLQVPILKPSGTVYRAAGTDHVAASSGDRQAALVDFSSTGDRTVRSPRPLAMTQVPVFPRYFDLCYTVRVKVTYSFSCRPWRWRPHRRAVLAWQGVDNRDAVIPTITSRAATQARIPSCAMRDRIITRVGSTCEKKWSR
jgi:hypothetical protein